MASTTVHSHATPPSPATRVFAIAELAEAIFLELPARQILVNVQRVCRQWKAVVDGSTPLQQALFLKPSTTEPLRFVKTKYDEYRESTDLTTVITRFDEPNRYLAEHPLVSHIAQSDERYVNILAIDRPDASWRKMLLTQPPIQACQFLESPQALDWKLKSGSGPNGEGGVLVGQTLEVQSWVNGGCWGSIYLKGWRNWDCCKWDHMSAKDFLQWVRVDLRKKHVE